LALSRLVRANPPGQVSLAGAYALGYGALGLAQQEGDKPDWFDDLDPLDTVFLGTAWPHGFRDEAEFGNARTAWLRLLRQTAHWDDVERFVHAVAAASEKHQLPVDDGELMLLLAGALEDAGLDKRKLPKPLLPGNALADARFAHGPPEDLALPEPAQDAAARVDRLWAGIQAALPHDGTPVDALREGLGMLAAAGLPVRDEPAILLPALYAALVASPDEELHEAGHRAWGWALGLRESSPLIPVADILLIAPSRGLDIDDVLRRLFSVPSFTAQVDHEDRRWHGAPGTDLAGLVFELGHTQITTRAGKAVRLDEGSVAMLRAQQARFEEKFGRPPGPDDPLFFDPRADEPQYPSLPEMEQATVHLLESAECHPAWIYAHQHTGGLLPRPDGGFAVDRDRLDWQEAIDRYRGAHPDADPVDHDAEAAKLRNVLVAIAIATAADHPEYGSAMARRLDRPRTSEQHTGSPAEASDRLGEDDLDIRLIGSYLTTYADELVTELRTNGDLQARTLELARAWGGSALHDHTRETINGQATQPPASVLLAIAVAQVHQT
jgi:hypothetical protein